MPLNEQVVIDQTVNNMLCYYVNSTSKTQLIQVTDDLKVYWKKIVFPQQRILFEAVPEFKLEIQNNQPENIRVTKTILCQKLKVN
ncbi:hypothetical protein C7B62_21700 [Pleurocapsa sp. CCALA 161]|uniref:DUF1830 domain-containing protein n=1 Tax=Pleurocapsa sp. CCALA 161 TaxID=2107688 RepID=UPI000D06665F|nr:DUF1830 domain-containing protein [Pleurocapsa sp. CCALA 161]PSB06846.1 hypothetical protein C7B62_21700 [Pleurocapsa sp. CCALA 161]